MKRRNGLGLGALGLALVLGAGVAASSSACSHVDELDGVPLSSIPGHGVPEDNTPKEGPRMVQPEAYIRTYLHLFGNLSPLEAQKALRAADGSALFDTWNDYLSSLGLPDYRIDAPRATQTNTLMLATFERLGIALCDRAAENDLIAGTPIGKRLVFDFDPGQGSHDVASFAPRFDVVHRTFLGYPAALGPSGRTSDYFDLYTKTVAAHSVKGAPASRLTPDQAGWASVCYALVRHPEFQFY